MTRAVLDNTLLVSLTSTITFSNLKNPKYLSGMKIGIIIESLSMPAVDPRVLKLFIASAERFKTVGASVGEASIPFHKVQL